MRVALTAALFLIPLLAHAGESSGNSATPLLDFAKEQPLPQQPFAEDANKRLATVQAQIASHPPPPDAECAHTLGAIRFARLYEDLASAQTTRGDSKGAIEAYGKALACTPRVAYLYANLASEQLHIGHLAEARTTAQRGVAIDGGDRTLDSVLSQIDFVEEHWAEAVGRLRAMATVEPDDERAQYWLMFLWLAQRRAGTREPELVTRAEYDLWPTPILETLQSRLSEARLLDLIRKEEDDHRRREMLAEALYYVGQMRLANGDADTARRYFAATVSLKVTYFIEHHLALAEIGKARAKMQAASQTARQTTRQ